MSKNNQKEGSHSLVFPQVTTDGSWTELILSEYGSKMAPKLEGSWRKCESHKSAGSTATRRTLVRPGPPGLESHPGCSEAANICMHERKVMYLSRCHYIWGCHVWQDVAPSWMLLVQPMPVPDTHHLYNPEEPKYQFRYGARLSGEPASGGYG